MKTLTFIPEGKHYRVKELDLLCSLPILKPVVTIENYSCGCRHSAHPNIDKTGSVAGMKKCGFWSKEDITYKQGSVIYNITKISCSGLLDELCFAIEQESYNCGILIDGTLIYHFE